MGGRALMVLAAAALLGGCGAEETPIEPVDDPLVQQFVGNWAADSVVLTSSGDSVITVNLIEEGGSITFNVQPSGTYTLALSWSGNALVDVGQIDVRTGYIVTRPSNGSPPETYAFAFADPDTFTLEGEVLFPFTSGTPTPGQLFTRLTR